MPFSNPIVAGTTLIRQAIESENYAVDSQSGNVTGWRVGRDGTATFTDLDVGNTAWGIDNLGNGTLATLNVTASDLTLGGVPLVGDLADGGILWNLPWGVIAWGQRTTNSVAAAAETPYLELQASLVNGRRYKVYTNSIFANTDTANGRTVLRLKYTTDGTQPGTASTQLASGRAVTPVVTSPTLAVMGGYAPGADVASFRVVLTVQGEVGNANILAGSIFPAELYIEDVGPDLGDQGIDRSGSGGTKQTYTKTYACSWSGSYYGDGSKRSTSNIYQGQYSGFVANGNQKSMIGFPFATIQSDLSGATVSKIEVYLYFDHWYFNSGGTAVIGTHNSSSGSAPSTWSGTASRVTSSSWPKPGGRWVSLGTTIGNEFKAGTSKGIVIGPGDTTANLYYGYADGVGLPNPPQLRITYTK